MVEQSALQEILAVPLPSRLMEAIAHELTDEEPSPPRLAESVRAYALECYARDVTPERMLVSLKAIVSSATDALDSRARAALITALIPFALEGYYLDSWIRRTGQPRTKPGATLRSLEAPATDQPG